MSKQFLLLCDVEGMYKLKDVFKEGSIEFLEVQGLNLNAENKLNVLVTPIVPVLNQAVTTPAPVESAPEAVPPLDPQ